MFQVSISVEKRDNATRTSSGKATARFGNTSILYTFVNVGHRLILKRAGKEVGVFDRESNLYCDVAAVVSRKFSEEVREGFDKQEKKLVDDTNEQLEGLYSERANFE